MSVMSQTTWKYANTDSVKTHGDLSTAVGNGRVRCLCEFRDNRIRPLLTRLDNQLNGILEGPEVAQLFQTHQSRQARVAGAGVVIGRSARSDGLATLCRWPRSKCCPSRLNSYHFTDEWPTHYAAAS